MATCEKDTCPLCYENNKNKLVKCELCEFVYCYNCIAIQISYNALPLDTYIDLHYEDCKWIEKIRSIFPNKDDNDLVGKINVTLERDWYSNPIICETFYEFFERTTNIK